MIKEHFLKWILGGITLCLTSIIVTFRKQIKDFIGFEQRQKKKKLLKNVYAEIDKQTKLSEERDTVLEEKIDKLRDDLFDILEPLRAATLTSHLDSLISKCKHHVRDGYITADDLDRIESDYETYKKLKGNGHMDTWMYRIRQLDVK